MVVRRRPSTVDSSTAYDRMLRSGPKCAAHMEKHALSGRLGLPPERDEVHPKPRRRHPFPRFDLADGLTLLPRLDLREGARSARSESRKGVKPFAVNLLLSSDRGLPGSSCGFQRASAGQVDLADLPLSHSTGPVPHTSRLPLRARC